MSELPPTLTCPAGHTFPSAQLTLREGLAVCPVCEGAGWARPRPAWSRGLLANPLFLLAGAALMFLVELISSIGLGVEYEHVRVAGAGWLVAGSSVAVVGAAVVIAGIVRLATVLRSRAWTRSLLAVPLVVVAVGTALLTVADLLDLGLNITFLNASDPGAGWQLTGQVFDILFYAGITGALLWASGLTRRSDPADQPTTPAPATVAEPVGASLPPTAL